MKHILELSEAGFEAEVLKADGPVVVDFYAPWCGPCKRLAPMLEQLAGEFEGKIRFGKLNVDDAQSLAARYGITGIPTVALFRGGEQVDSIVGLPAARALKTWLEEASMAAPQVRQ